MSIPNEIKIQLVTNIPGYQMIDYKPKMTIPDINGKKVFFWPLIKLNSNIIDTKIPENLRQKQFFNKGLFNSLINTHGFFKDKTLEQATKEGLVDNNILVTLKTLFPVKGLFYLNKNTYTIGNLSWEKGNWKITLKPKPVLKSQEVINNPYLYNKLVHSEIISGEQQINALPDDVVYGDNFMGVRNNVAKGVDVKDKINIIDEKIPSSTETTSNLSTEQALVPIDKKIPSSTETTPTETTPNLSTEQALVPIDKIAPSNANDNLPSSQEKETQQPSNKLIPIDSGTINQIERLSDEPTPNPILIANKKLKSEFKLIITNKDFLYILNSLYNYLPRSIKLYLTENMSFSTAIDVANLNKKSARPKLNNKISIKAYERLVEGLRIYSNTGGGDCFFKAVCDGITNNNHQFPNDPILYNNIGIGNNIFTIKILREIVYNYLINIIPDLLEQYLSSWSLINVDNLNTKFKKHLDSLTAVGEDINDQIYMDTVNQIYQSDDNFLVSKISEVPSINSESYNNPFKVIIKSQLKSYILSSEYWGNIIAINAISYTLNLNVIPIELLTVNNNKTLRVNTPNLINDNIDNNWTKYIFLLKTPGHFELMGFILKTKIHSQGNQTRSKTVTIFNRFIDTSKSFMAPIFIILIIYSSYYRNLSLELRNKFNFFPNIFKYIYEADGILINRNIHFNQIMNNVFPNLINTISNTQSGGRQISDNDEDENPEICYKIQISLLLVEGKDIDKSQINSLACQTRANSIYKSWAGIRGQNYIPPPDYSLSKVNKTVDNKKKGGNGKTKKIRIYQNN